MQRTYGDIVANDSWQGSILCIVLCYMHYNVVLDIAVFTNFDAVDISCSNQSNTSQDNIIVAIVSSYLHLRAILLAVCQRLSCKQDFSV